MRRLLLQLSPLPEVVNEISLEAAWRTVVIDFPSLKLS